MEDRPTVLVPLRVLEGESVPEGVPDLLANAHVVLLGYHVVPDQTATDQAREQFESQATSRLDDFTAMFEDAGATVESRLVFTHEGQQTMDRVSEEHDCLAVLIPNATGAPEEILVAIRGVVGLDRFVRLLSGLFATSDVGITLFHVAEADETDEDVETLLDAVRNRLTEQGVDPESIDHMITREENPQQVIADASDEFDAVVMGESDPSVVTFLFGMRAEQVADQFLGPVLVVQREEEKTPDE